MGRNRRQNRLRQRRQRPTEGGGASPGGNPPPRSTRPAWRNTIDSWGGFTVVGAILGAVLVAALLVFLNRPGNSANGAEFVANEYDAPTNGRVLGDPDAPVRVIEFTDFQCPFCHRFWEDTKPEIVKNYVETGLVSLEARDLQFIGPESGRAAEAAACAADQDYYWDFHDLLFLRQGAENQGVFSDSNLKQYASQLDDAVDGFDRDAWEQCFDAGTHTLEVQQTTQQAQALGYNTTPTIVIGGGSVIRGAQDYQVFEQAIDAALAIASAASPTPSATPSATSSSGS